MQQRVDPTFYRSPGEAMAAPHEQLAYVTNSLYGVWDDLSYPQGMGAWMAKLDTDPHAGAPS
jgi:hypothetical protein